MNGEEKLMILKKRFWCLFSNVKLYEIQYEDEVDFRANLLKLLTQLKKELYLIQVFSPDPVNTIIKKLCNTNGLIVKNFTFYQVWDLDTISKIDFSHVRFMRICIIEKNDLDENNLNKMIRQCPCMIELDNYLEIAEARIDLSRYSLKDINELLS